MSLAFSPPGQRGSEAKQARGALEQKYFSSSNPHPVKVFLEIFGDSRKEMPAPHRPREGVGLLRIKQRIELLSRLDELLRQLQAVLHVPVVVGGAVHEQQFAAQAGELLVADQDLLFAVCGVHCPEVAAIARIIPQNEGQLPSFRTPLQVLRHAPGQPHVRENLFNGEPLLSKQRRGKQTKKGKGNRPAKSPQGLASSWGANGFTLSGFTVKG